MAENNNSTFIDILSTLSDLGLRTLSGLGIINLKTDDEVAKIYRENCNKYIELLKEKSSKQNFKDKVCSKAVHYEQKVRQANEFGIAKIKDEQPGLNLVPPPLPVRSTTLTSRE